ncbi:hypothetical protein DID88_007939 [Monilinia fructigena]|uniref:Peptidase M14 domain-containing protein n=1 Tax=Monilinia fructigena TaxID=38457 RepID=A0A395J487_9HELO|nr:hypothetical protein DID88_007939 [Monilinia fructigena]
MSLPRGTRGKPRIARRQANHGIAIGTGDRYSAGTIAPRGVGSQTTTITTLMNVQEIASAIKGLANVYVRNWNQGCVDLNRNFDFLWDLNKFAPSVRNDVASADPASVVFHGTAAFSEPETQSVKWVMDTYSKVRWFVDLHAYAGDILYSWGSDTNQASYPHMNFLNSSYDAVRGIVTDTPGSGSAYGEYTPNAEFTTNKAARDPK